MTTRFPTISFCPTCYAEVSASVTVGREGVTMNKSCPHHGQFTSMVERDPLFYQVIRGLRAPSIYDGYFVDVTRKCNLRCTHCYYKLETTDPEKVRQLKEKPGDKPAERYFTNSLTM